ncbi:MAG: site-2 protease family protein [Acidobacteriota bacterium]|nr:site-2 protease family protein [Acidobacteriota bacterium]
MSGDNSAPTEQASEFLQHTVRHHPTPEKNRIFLPTILLVCTFVTSLAAGYAWHVRFLSRSQYGPVRIFNDPADLLSGLPFALTIMVILIAHEMGHYIACRYYGLKVTLPYLIPGPPPFNPFGTFGAFIKIRSRFVNRRQLFDVGIAGPLAGFVFIIPALIIGLQQSTEVVFTEPLRQTLEFGRPLLVHLATPLYFPGDPDAAILLHPIGQAAWFGMLATSMNLLPIGQLDGGHITYALFGTRGHRIISYTIFGTLIGISLYSFFVYGIFSVLGYLLFAFLLLFLGFRHPRPCTKLTSLGTRRKIIALIGFVIFVLTAIPVPVRIIKHIGSL